MKNIKIITDGEEIFLDDVIELDPLTKEKVNLKFKIKTLGKIAILGMKY